MKNTKAFTLIEVMISIVLLGLIFTYLYGTINSMKQQNRSYIVKSDNMHYQRKVYQLFYLDISRIVGGVAISIGDSYDRISFKTKNSLYEIDNPYITYFVSKKDKALIRIESLKPFNFNSKDDASKSIFFADIVAKNMTSFKLFNGGGFVEMLFRAKELKPMVLKIPTIS